VCDVVNLQVGRLRVAAQARERSITAAAGRDHDHALGLVDGFSMLSDPREGGLDFGFGFVAADLGQVDEVALDAYDVPSGPVTPWPTLSTERMRWLRSMILW
jgi:hypothetical protein